MPCPPSAPGTSPCRRWHEEVVFLGHPRRAGGREENTPGGSRGGESGAPRVRRRGPRGLPSPLHKPLGTWAGGAAATPFLRGKRGDCNTETAAATRPRGPRSCLSAAGPGKATGKASVNAGSVLCSPQRVTSIFQAAPPAGLFLLLLPSFALFAPQGSEGGETRSTLNNGAKLCAPRVPALGLLLLHQPSSAPC